MTDSLSTKVEESSQKIDKHLFTDHDAIRLDIITTAGKESQKMADELKREIEE